MALHKVSLIIIDPQLDFCHKDGALCVSGAYDDMLRVAKMIERLDERIADIHVTLDSHHPLHIAHPIWWQDGNGQHPAPFTIISVEDVEKGRWTTTKPSQLKRSREYVRQLAKNGRYPLCIWPPHCLIGSWGHGVVPELHAVLRRWEEKHHRPVEWLTKGSNFFTEHYGALQADVPDPADPYTQLNTDFIKQFEDAQTILLCGEAGSHCLRHTVTDMANNFGNQADIGKFVLLADGTSPVPGFEQQQKDFITEMTGRGMQLSSTVDFLDSKATTIAKATPAKATAKRK